MGLGLHWRLESLALDQVYDRNDLVLREPAFFEQHVLHAMMHPQRKILIILSDDLDVHKDRQVHSICFQLGLYVRQVELM